MTQIKSNKEPLSEIIICKTTTDMKNKLLKLSEDEGFRDFSDYLRQQWTKLLKKK